MRCQLQVALIWVKPFHAGQEDKRIQEGKREERKGDGGRLHAYQGDSLRTSKIFDQVVKTHKRLEEISYIIKG